ncbi:MAG: hypothetical protein RIC15_09740 [Vicingaceae bacterium]
METAAGYHLLLKSPDKLALKLTADLLEACKCQVSPLDFKHSIQFKNLSSLLADADLRIQRYEQIYPYIKELSIGQKINPSLYDSLEKMLNWALSKGRGRIDELPRNIKDAWLSYIAILSCSMIDRKMESKLNLQIRGNLKKNLNKIKGSKGNN